MFSNKLIYFLITISLASSTIASSGISLSESPEGRNIKSYSEKNFEIKHLNTNLFKTKIIENSIKWLRVNKVLLIPTARLAIKVPKSESVGLELVYKNKAYSFEQYSDEASLEIEFSLYEQEPISIFKNNKIFESITILRKSKNQSQVTIDDTCSRNKVVVQGLADEAITLGCRLYKKGSFGSEQPVLEVDWVSPDLKLQNEQTIQTAVFTQNSTHRVQVQNIHSKAQKMIIIRATLPKRIHRLFTAAGLGPYVLETQLETTDEDRNIYEPVAPALFLYANYQISSDQSIRGFNAAVFKESIFDNAGLYLGSDFGFTFDNRLYFTTLIGMQYLYFKFDEESDVISEPIFPQGIEFMYRHAFDIPNYIVSGGFFVSTSSEVEYQNAWIRWGQKYFWELNYIGWAKDNFSAKMWGVSIGFPLKGFL